METPKDPARVEADQTSDLVERPSLRNRCAAVFLDRDGTLNVEVGRIRTAAQLELIAGAGAAVERLNRAGLLAVVVTNQAAISSGDCSEAELERIHDKLETLLAAEGACLDGLYYCPHHPDAGIDGERPGFKIPCDCRKPGTAMIERAASELFIDMQNSWMVGDTTTDLQTARNAGIRSVLVRTGHAGRDRRWPARADFEFFDLNEAVEFISETHAPLLRQAQTLLPACAPGSLLAIGGLSRSGKSTWASLFCEVLAERGQRAVVLPLDAWLRSAAEREPGHVLQRFDVDAMTALVRRLDGRIARLVENLGFYDRLTRQRDEQGESITIEPDDVVVLEGVPALAIDALVAASSSSFYVECPEGLRRERFEREYRLRGATDPEIEKLYRERESDEHPFIRESSSLASIRIGSAS